MTLEFEASLRLGPFSYEAAFDAAPGEVVVLFGHSGAGKSVTLQTIAGLMRPQSGRIALDGRVLFDAARGIDLPPQDRGVGYVVQDLALFPHLSVAENVGFGLRGPRTDRAARVRALLDRLGLEGFEQRMPGTLSGGQRQRVALARALARDVPLLLLDEPFSALDESLRRTLRAELLRLRAELGLTVVFVTHDLREAHLLADRLAVFDRGRILQYAARDEVFRRPESRRVAELTGVANVLAGTVLSHRGDRVEVDVAGVPLQVPVEGWLPEVGAPVELALRAERVILRRGAPESLSAANIVEVRVARDDAYGAGHTLHLEPVGVGPVLEVDLPSRPYEVLGVSERRQWVVELPVEDLHLMRPQPSEEGASR